MSSFQSFILNGIFVAIVAHGLIGISLVWDKVLLKKQGMKNLLSYVFWLGAISVFGLVAAFFGFKLPQLRYVGMGSAAGLLDLVATYFFFAALKAGEASEEVAALGGFGSVATALIAIPLLKNPIGGELLGFIVMTLGGFVLFFASKVPLKKMLPKIFLASVAFGMTNVLQKIVFDHTNFVTGFCFYTTGTFIGATALLIPPSWRQQIFQHSEDAPPRSKIGYMINRFLAGVGSFLVIFAISRTSPVLVEAISGVRYVIIFLAAYAITRWKPSWFREDFRGWTLAAKVLATCLVIAGLALVGLHGGSWRY